MRMNWVNLAEYMRIPVKLSAIDVAEPGRPWLKSCRFHIQNALETSGFW